METKRATARNDANRLDVRLRVSVGRRIGFDGRVELRAAPPCRGFGDDAVTLSESEAPAAGEPATRLLMISKFAARRIVDPVNEEVCARSRKTEVAIRTAEHFVGVVVVLAVVFPPADDTNVILGTMLQRVVAAARASLHGRPLLWSSHVDIHRNEVATVRYGCVRAYTSHGDDEYVAR